MLKQRLVLVAAGVLILLVLGGGFWLFFLWARDNYILTFVKTFLLIKREYLQPVSTATLIEGSIRGMVDALGDPYSVYLDEDLYQELDLQIEGSFGGIGVEIDLDGKKRLVVVAPLPGTPADRAGVKSGDIIVEIEGRNTEKITLIEAAQLLRGKPGTRVSFKVWRESENRFIEFNIVRDEITIPSVTWKMLPGHSGLGYIRVLQFNRTSTIPQLQEALASLERDGCRGLILDLRDNPGGDLHVAVELAGYFIPDGPVVRIVHRGGAEEVWRSSNNKKIAVPLVVLVNEGSASASEIVAGAIKDSGSGILVGTRTFGKGLVQTVFTVGDDVGVKLTTDKYLTPKGRDIHGKGIEPDVYVEQPDGGNNDRQLERAIEILEKILQDSQRAAA